MKKFLFRFLALAAIVILLCPFKTLAQTFNIAAGDVNALIAAMNATNANGPGADVINLAAGTYSLSVVDNQYVYIDSQHNPWGGGPNGLPPVLGDLTINGQGTIIERATDAPDFRFFTIAGTGRLTLNAVTLQHGQLLDANIDVYGHSGGAVYSTGQFIAHDSVFTDNQASGGGAISNRGPRGSGLWLYYSMVKDNYATEDGGGIFTSLYSSLFIESSTIADNHSGIPVVGDILSGLGGGLSIEGQNDVTIRGTSITGNYTEPTGYGGGIYTITSYPQAVIMSDSTVSGNDAAYGDGIYAFATNYELTNVTIADNQGVGLLGGSGQFTFSNVLFSNNTDHNCAAFNFSTPPENISQGHNLDTDGSCHLQAGTDLNNVSAQLMPLADNGGPTFTRALSPNSPAINHGNPLTCAAVDQRGAPREGICDIGAVEGTSYVAAKLVQISPLDGAALLSTSVTFLWQQIPNVTGYELQYGQKNDLSDAITVTTATPSYLSPILLQQRYYWRVRSIHFNGSRSAWTSIWRFTLPSPANAAPPLNFYTTAFPLLTWNRVSWAIGYAVEIADNPNFTNPYWSSNQLDSNTLAVQPDKALYTGQWYWHVKARHVDGSWGSWSATGTFYVDVPPTS